GRRATRTCRTATPRETAPSRCSPSPNVPWSRATPSARTPSRPTPPSRTPSTAGRWSSSPSRSSYGSGGRLWSRRWRRPRSARHWQQQAGLGFKLPGGYFNGPYGADRTGIYGASPRYTSDLLRDVGDTGVVPKLDATWQAQARRDFAYWRAGALVVAPGPHDE